LWILAWDGGDQIAEALACLTAFRGEGKA